MLVIEDEIVRATRLTEEELRREIAVLLHEKGRLTFSEARRLSGLDWLSFEQILFERGIPIQYDTQDLADDLETFKALRNP
jgi:predicted HTH domain antitoxin